MKRYKSAEQIEETLPEIESLPKRPRRKKDNRKIIRIFYMILTGCFVILTVSLLLWGFLGPSE